MHKETKDDKRVIFGQRLLTDNDLVFQHNAWDNVEWDSNQEEEARQKVTLNSSTKASLLDQEKYETGACNFWDDFYNVHDNRFFKDRHWLFTEFPELSGKNIDTCSNGGVDSGVNEVVNEKKQMKSSDICNSISCNNTNSNDESIKANNKKYNEHETFSHLQPQTLSQPPHTSSQPPQTSKQTPQSSSQPTLPYPGQFSKTRILEVGCGVGNTIFPILETNNDADLFVYGCDLSTKAIDIIKNSDNYEASRCHVFVSDVSNHPHFPFPPQSLDFIILIFVLSAIKPEKMQTTLEHLITYLKPGGMLLFRDYGRYDLAQLRFKKGRCLEDNFYVRGDGTRVYFFTQEELRSMFSGLGLEEVQNHVDRRLQVNRGRQLKMFRVWMQCKYRKPQLS